MKTKSAHEIVRNKDNKHDSSENKTTDAKKMMNQHGFLKTKMTDEKSTNQMNSKMTDEQNDDQNATRKND